MRNYGLNLELEAQHRSETDWLAGAASQAPLFVIPLHERENYLPKGEVQRGKEDMMDCSTRADINILEAYFTYGYKNNKFSPLAKRWLERNGYVNNGKIEFSDAFNAILSGTTRQGNSLKAPLESIRKDGLIPKKMLPLESSMTWEDYHSPERITKEMKYLGSQFAYTFTINYEIVYVNDFEKWLQTDLINVAGYAWPQPVEGVYPRVNYPFNHAFAAYRPKYFIFDNYIDSFDGDFIKHLATDYNFLAYGYRVFISSERTWTESNYWFVEILKVLIDLAKDLTELSRKKLGTLLKGLKTPF